MTVSMQDVYWVSADLLMLGAKIAESTELPPVAATQRRIGVMLEQLEENARSIGLTEDDIVDLRYAICAFIDEQVMRWHPAAGVEWLPQSLQMTYFNENRAGEGFFARLAVLKRDRTRAAITQIYYLCIAFGFSGTYARRGADTLGDITSQLSVSLMSSLAENRSEVAKSSEKEQGGKKRFGAEASLVMAAALLVTVSLGIVSGLKWVLASAHHKTIESIAGASPAHEKEVGGSFRTIRR